MRGFALMPRSQSLRKRLHEELLSLAHNLVFYANESLTTALNITASDALSLFGGKVFESVKKSKESEAAMQVGIAERLNTVIRACNSIIKSINSR